MTSCASSTTARNFRATRPFFSSTCLLSAYCPPVGSQLLFTGSLPEAWPTLSLRLPNLHSLTFVDPAPWIVSRLSFVPAATFLARLPPLRPSSVLCFVSDS